MTYLLENQIRNFYLKMLIEMIYYNMSNDTLVEGRRGNYFDLADGDLIIDFNLKEFDSNIDTLKISRTSLREMCYN
jgi:hypothetical protein